MSILTVYPLGNAEIPNKVLTHTEDIAATLAEQGVHFERRELAVSVRPEMPEQAVLDACQAVIEPLLNERGHRHVEVLSPDRQNPDSAGVVASLRDAHQRDGDETRVILGGRGLLSLQLGEHIYQLLCEKHDLIVIPAGTTQWFDLGEQPALVALRLFSAAAQRVVAPVDRTLASRFPGLDD